MEDAQRHRAAHVPDRDRALLRRDRELHAVGAERGRERGSERCRVGEGGQRGEGGEGERGDGGERESGPAAEAVQEDISIVADGEERAPVGAQGGYHPPSDRGYNHVKRELTMVDSDSEPEYARFLDAGPCRLGANGDVVELDAAIVIANHYTRLDCALARGREKDGVVNRAGEGGFELP